MLAKSNNGGVLLKLAIVLVVLAGVAAAVAFSLQSTARVKPAGRDTATDAVTGSVYVDADGGTKELKSEAAGKVVWCEAIDPGKRFKENDVLVQLDTTELERTIADTRRRFLEEKERDELLLTGGKPELLREMKELSDEERVKIYQQANPARRLAAERLQTAERLRDLGNAAEEDVRSARRALEQEDLQLKLKVLEEKKREAEFKSTIAMLELQKDRMAVRAPSDGEIIGALTWRGALIGPGQVVATFMSNERVVTAKISEESFGKVKLGQRARIRLLTYGEQYFEATVSKLLPKADEAQRFTVYLDVKPDPERPQPLNPGSTGEVTITVAEHPNQVVIPRRALIDNNRVFVVKNGRVQRRDVKPGFLALNVAEIREGLEVGEHVIVDQLDRFRDGQRVRIEVVN